MGKLTLPMVTDVGILRIAEGPVLVEALILCKLVEWPTDRILEVIGWLVLLNVAGKLAVVGMARLSVLVLPLVIVVGVTIMVGRLVKMLALSNVVG